MANEAVMAQVLRQDPTPQPEMLGTGMAAEAGKAIQSRGYKIYAAEAAAMGETPKTYEEWMKGQ
jgi:hypothetical protein